MADYNLGTAKGEIVIDADLRGLSEADKAIKTADRNINNYGSSLSSAQRSLNFVANAALATGIAVAGGFALAVKTAADFEKQLSAIQAVSGATAGEMDRVSDAALRIGKDTAFSASDAASAFEELIKAGISVEDSLNGAADATVALAAAGGIDLPTAANLAAQAMNMFGLEAKDLVGVTNDVAGAANASAIDVNQFAYSMSQVGAVAHLAGLDFHDTAVAIAEMGNAGIVGSDAGTSLKQVLLNLIPVTDKQKKVAQELGIITADGANQFFNAAGEAKGLREIQEVLAKATAGLTKEQKLANLEILFGSDAIRGAAVLAAEGAEGYDKLSEAIGNVTAAEVAATRMNNLNGQIEQLKGSAETLAIMLGQILVPYILAVVKSVNELLNWFIELDDTTKRLFATIGATLAVGLIFVGIMTKMVAVSLLFRDALLAATGTATLLGNAGAIAAVKLQLLTAAQWLFNAAVNANKIVLIISLVAGLIAAYAAWGKENEQLRKSFEPVMKSFQRLAEQLMPVLNKLGGTFAKLASKLLEALAPAILGIVQIVADLLVPIIDALAPILKSIANIITRVLAPVVGILGVAFGVVAKVLEVIFKILGPIIDVLVAILVPILEAVVWVLDLVAKGFEVMGKIWEKVSGKIVELLQPVFDAFAEFGELFAPIFTLFQDLYDRIIKPLGDKMQAALAPFVEWFKNNFKEKLEQFVEGLRIAWDKFKEKFGLIIAGIKLLLQPWVDWFKTEVEPKLTLIPTVIGVAWETLKATFQRVVGAIQLMLAPFVTAFETARDAIGRVITYIQEHWGALESRFGPPLERIAAAFGRVKDSLSRAWESMEPTLQKLGDAFGRLGDAIGRIFEAIGKAILAVFGGEEGDDSTAVGKMKKSTEEVTGEESQSKWDKILQVIERVCNGIALALEKVAAIVEGVATTISIAVAIITIAFEGMARGATIAVDTVAVVLGSLPTVVKTAFDGASKWLVGIGTQIITGLVNGLRWAIDNLVKPLLQGVTKLIPEWKGPADVDKKLLYENGQFIMRGLAAGIQSEVGNVMGMLQGLTANIPVALAGTLVPGGGSGRGGDKNFIYNAAPGGAQFTAEDEFRRAAKLTKVVVPGWAD